MEKPTFINQMEPWFGKEEKESLAEYMESGGWLTEFKKTREFEKQIADYVGAKHCSVVNNGTISLAVALWSLGVKGEVLVPDYTMIASANSVVLSGAKPVLVDINPRTLCMDLQSAKRAVTKETQAIILVSLNGRSPDMDEFVKFSEEKNLFLIEDSAQSLGSKHNGKHLGTFGNVGSFSFSMPKIITTGQGGCLVTDDGELYKKILKIKDFGREAQGVDIHTTMGYNFKFTDLQAVVGIEQMKKLEWRVIRKKEMFKLYRDLLLGVKGVEFVETDLDNTPPWFMDILVKKEKRAGLIDFLKERGVGSRPFYPAIHTQLPYSHIKGDFKNSEEISKRGLWLPSSSFLKDEQIRYITEAIKSFYD